MVDKRGQSHVDKSCFATPKFRLGCSISKLLNDIDVKIMFGKYLRFGAMGDDTFL